MYRRRRPNSLVCDGDDDLERPLRDLLGVSLLLRFIVFVRALAPRPVRLIVAPPPRPVVMGPERPIVVPPPRPVVRPKQLGLRSPCRNYGKGCQ